MEKIYEVKNRVKNLVEERGFSYNYLSLKFGKNPTYLQKFVKEKSPKRLDEEFRKKLAVELGVDEQELTDLPLVKNVAYIHKIGFVQAGVFTENNQLPQSEWEQVFYAVPETLQGKKVFALGVKGNSMNKIFLPENTTLICLSIEDYIKLEPNGVRNGDFIVAERQTPDGLYETTVKRYNKLLDGTIVLESMSTDLKYTNIIIGQDNADYKIIAIVVDYQIKLKDL